MLIDFSISEIVVIRQALREYRTVAPDHVIADAGRLVRWQEERKLYDDDRESADRKVTEALASTV